MTQLLTAARMRALEQAAIDSGAVTGLELMERAGQGVVDAIFEHWPDLARTSHRAVVLCGPGNNGGDGFVIARLLRGWGWSVDTFIYGSPETLPADARANLDRWQAMGGTVRHDLDAIPRLPCELVIDALFGTGLSRPVETRLSQLMTLCRAPIVAVDVLSGLCADSGRWLGRDPCPRAALTVTFHAAKQGHYLAQGPETSGVLRVADIGLKADAPPETVRLVDHATCQPALAAVLGKRDGHKFSHGHALVLSGPMGRSGAARLAARAALRIGAGLVTVGAPGSAMMECACQLTAIMLRKLEDGAALTDMLKDDRITALCLGPGLGHARARDLVPAALASGRPCVLDADALSAYSDDPDGLFSRLHGKIVLTPHGGEFARLFPDLAAKLTEPAQTGPAYCKISATREAAKRAGCVILFKGADTVIATADGAAIVHAAAYDRTAHWLATAGSGDVLAGILAGLLARGVPVDLAAGFAAFLHVEAARAFGPGLIAEDLPEQFPTIISRLAELR